jgi:hypothetical protein
MPLFTIFQLYRGGFIFRGNPKTEVTPRASSISTAFNADVPLSSIDDLAPC